MSEYIFKLPDLGEGTVESEISEWSVNIGDTVAEEDTIAVMMTDKAAVELSAPVAGKIVRLAGEPGDVIAVGAPLVVFETAAGAVANAEAAPPANDAPAARSQGPVPVNARSSARIVTSPAIRRRAKEAGIDLTLVAGSGPNGRILPKDFDAHVKGAGPATQPTPVPATAAQDREIKIIGLRRLIAERMSASKREIPHFAYVEEMDITELESLRKHLNARVQDNAQRLTLLPFIATALVRALREFPQCNATHNKERNVIIQHGAVHLGIATQTPDGLKVPVVRNCEQRDLNGIAAEIRRLSDAARDNKIKRDELMGSTITLTSLGKLGGIASTPVINQPEVGIIGVNRAVKRPVVVDNEVTVRLMMNLSSSFDHRFVDGYDAAAMIQRIKEMLEHPATMFLPTPS